MNRSLFVLLGVPVLAGISFAQSGPGVSRAEQVVKAFTSVTGESQCQLNQFKGQAAGVYTASVTLGSSLVIGIYDQNADTFTQTTEAAALNPNSGNFGLMLDSTGKYCVFDRADGVYFSNRSGPGVAFPAPVKVNSSLSGYVDPALAYYGGKLQLIWTTGADIQMQELDISNLAAPTLAGTPRAIAKRVNTSGSVHSPTPVYGPDGDVEGLWLAESSGTDMWFKAGLDPSQPHIKVLDNTSWSNNGGVAGSHLIYIRSGAVRDVEASYLTGDVESPGGVADIGAAAPSSKGNSLTVVYMSDKVMTPITLPAPFNVGQFGLNLAVLIPLTVIVEKGANQTGSASFKIPNDPKLKGAIAIQGISLDTDSTFPYNWVLTNTAEIVVQ